MRLREAEGSVTLLTAIVLMALLAASAVAVDVGRLAVVSRDQQGATDRAALDALLTFAREGPTADVQAAVSASLDRNLGVSGASVVSMRTGSGMSSARSLAGSPTPWDCATMSPRAAWGDADGVLLRTTNDVGSIIFRNVAATTVEREAIACMRPVGAVSAASTTASVDNGLLNDLLSALVGGEVALDLAGYRGVAAANIDLAVLATEAGVSTVDDLLTTRMSVGGLTEAVASALEANDPDTEALGLASELRALATAAVGLDDIVLGEIVTIDVGAEVAGGTLAVDALELVIASVQLANRNHAVELDLSFEGELLPVTLTVIEPPRIAVGRPGREADGTWRTEAPTAQLELAVGLPVGQLDSDTSGELTSDQAARIADYRARIDAATSTSQVHAIGEELKAELEEVEQHLEDHGYSSLAAAVRALIDDLVQLLADIADGLLCLLTPLSCAKADMHEKVDEYEAILGDIDTTASADKTSTRPTLTVTTGQGWARLASIGCGDPLEATVELEARAGHVGLPRTRVLDLGPLGSITIELDTSLGTGASPTSFGFTAPFPTDSQRHGGATVGLGTALSSVDTSGSQLLLLPVGQVASLVTSALGPVLDAVDDAVLTPALELLGADLGSVEGRVLDASCSSRTLVR